MRNFLGIDYCTFGAPMAGRSYQSGSYRYGFNNMEKVDELHGNSGDSYDFGARIYDARLGRWLSVDRSTKDIPNYSPYNFSYNSPVIFNDPDGNYPKIVISDVETGYTVSKMYGKSDYKVLVVPTYKMIIYDVDANGVETVIGEHNVTRDGWYGQGTTDEGDEHWVNRTSEPVGASVEVGAIATVDYGDTKGAYALNEVAVEAYPEEWATFEDGTPVPDHACQGSPGVGTGVMVHIGGYFTTADGTYHIAGTYGCFGVVADAQVFASPEAAEGFARAAVKVVNNETNPMPGNVQTSNSEMNSVVNNMQTATQNAKDRGESNASDIKVEIIKRADVQREIICTD